MDSVAVLGARDEERLLRAIEFALPIRTHGQFFVWAQSYLQPLIGHEMLLCASTDPLHRRYSVVKVSTLAIAEEQLAQMGDPRTGLIAHAVEAWGRNGEKPLAIFADKAGPPQSEALRDAMRRHRIANLVIHGTGGVDSSQGAYFVLSGISHPYAARHEYLFNLILPYLRATLERILAHQRHQGPAKSPSRQVKKQQLTQREIQILEWVQDGKSNREIGAGLKISPLTVKNHIQHILKKLGAQNRAQALSQAIALKLVK
ncbi:MAG: XrtB/PEP-CTERM-associated transcriptional regulator EpsA [Betaproteobacteria bacterium]